MHRFLSWLYQVYWIAVHELSVLSLIFLMNIAKKNCTSALSDLKPWQEWKKTAAFVIQPFKPIAPPIDMSSSVSLTRLLFAYGRKLVRGGRPAFDLTLIKSNGINYYFQRLWQAILKFDFFTFIILSWLWNVVKLILKLNRRSSISKSREIELKAVGVLVSVTKNLAV